MTSRIVKPFIGLFFLACALFLVGLATATGSSTSSTIDPRLSTWAVKMKRIDGVPNFNKINEFLYRSAQPTEAGMDRLRQLGIKTIINLRAFHSDTDEMGATGVLNGRLHVKTWHIEDEDVIKVMKIISHRENGPFLIHCQHGADRTGVMCALYRILYQGWTKEQAIDEMIHGGYGFHPLWSNIIKYIQSVDIEKLRKAI